MQSVAAMFNAGSIVAAWEIIVQGPDCNSSCATTVERPLSASNSVLKAAECPLDLNPSGKGTAQSIVNATKFGAQHGDNHMSPSHLDFVCGKYYLADA